MVEIYEFITPPQSLPGMTLRKKKVQKLSLGLYLFKRYTLVPKGCILVP